MGVSIDGKGAGLTEKRETKDEKQGRQLREEEARGRCGRGGRRERGRLEKEWEQFLQKASM